MPAEIHPYREAGGEIDAFERWAVDSGYSIIHHEHVDFFFADTDTEAAWHGWQARACPAMHARHFKE